MTMTRQKISDTTSFRTFGIAALLAVVTWMPVPAAAATQSAWPDELFRDSVIRPDILGRARTSYEAARPRIGNRRHIVIVDYSLHSSKPRLFLIDTDTGEHEALLVSHGRGSDPDHDGRADRFSNVEGSKMSSLGAYVTREIYYGKHGMSLRLVGLEASNDRALERAIVMHGADYVARGRAVTGRSWGCPAIAQRHVARLLPKLAGGAFLYIAR